MVKIGLACDYASRITRIEINFKIYLQVLKLEMLLLKSCHNFHIHSMLSCLILSSGQFCLNMVFFVKTGLFEYRPVPLIVIISDQLIRYLIGYGPYNVSTGISNIGDVLLIYSISRQYST